MTARSLPCWRGSILVHSEDTHGNQAARSPPALQLLPADPQMIKFTSTMQRLSSDVLCPPRLPQSAGGKRLSSLLLTHSPFNAECLPSTRPSSLLPLSFLWIFLSSVHLLFRSHSASASDCGDCVPPLRAYRTPDMCSGRGLPLHCPSEGGSVLGGGEARSGWGLNTEGGVF